MGDTMTMTMSCAGGQVAAMGVIRARENVKQEQGVRAGVSVAEYLRE